MQPSYLVVQSQTLYSIDVSSCIIDNELNEYVHTQRRHVNVAQYPDKYQLFVPFKKTRVTRQRQATQSWDYMLFLDGHFKHHADENIFVQC